MALLPISASTKDNRPALLALASVASRLRQAKFGKLVENDLPELGTLTELRTLELSLDAGATGLGLESLLKINHLQSFTVTLVDNQETVVRRQVAASRSIERLELHTGAKPAESVVPLTEFLACVID